MLIKNEIMEKKMKISGVAYESVYIDKEGVRWFYAMNVNGLYKILSNNVIEYICSDQSYLFIEKRLYGAICGIENILILAPLRAEHIMVFNKNDNSTIFIDLPPEVVGYKSQAYTFSCAIKNNKAYIIGHMCPFILLLNLDNFQIEVIKIKEEKELRYGYFRKQFAFVGDDLIIPNLNLNKVLILNTKNLAINEKYIGEKDCCFSGIVKDEEILWIISINMDTIYKWNFEKDNLEKIRIPEGIVKGKFRFLDVVLFNKCLYITTAYDNPLVIYDIEKNSFGYKQFINSGNSIAPIRCIYIYENKLIAVMENGGSHIEIQENEKESHSEIEINIDNEYYNKLANNRELIQLDGATIDENELFQLDVFLRLI